MREMKDSGNQWIGIVPNGWSIDRFKHCTVSYTGNSIKDERKNNYEDASYAKPYISSKDINKLFSTINYESGLYIKNNDYSFKVARKNDILMCIEGGSAGKKKAMLNQDVCFVNKLCCFHPDSKLDNIFLFYYLCNPAYEDEFNYNITGMIGGVSVSKLGNLNIVYPKIAEQKRITAYLNEKCKKINEIMVGIQNQIDTLEDYKKSVISEAVTRGLDPNEVMKDSGVSYIGKIPSSWKTDKGKFIFTYLQKPTKEDDGVITCFRDGEVTLRSNRREEGFTISEKEIGYQGIDIGDLIVHGMDGFAGSIGISDSRGKASPVLNVLETTNNKRYYMYFLRNMAYRGVFIALATGIRVRTCDTNWGKLREIVYAIPPRDEQDKIAKYIDGKCAEIDSIIENKKAQLETIENYKRSLIYEYVTGKKEVPENE